MKAERCGWCRKEPRREPEAGGLELLWCENQGCASWKYAFLEVADWNAAQPRILESRKRDFEAARERWDGGNTLEKYPTFDDYLRESEKD